jgi:hypothetical protein
MISSILKIAAALPINPIFEVFSRKCGVSEITDAGIAIASFFLLISHAPFTENLYAYVQLKS